MTRFGPPLPSLKPNGRKSSQKPHGKHTSAASAGIKPRRMSLGNTFVSSSDVDFDEEFKKGPKDGSSRDQKKAASNLRRMSLTPRMHETGRFNINNNKENSERNLRRMSLEGACKKESAEETGVAAKNCFPSYKQAASSHINKQEQAKHASAFKESVQHIADDVDARSVKNEDVVWRDGLLQQWDSLLDASSGFKSISVAYDEHRRKSDEAITGSLDLTKADDDTDLSLPKVDTKVLEKTAALAAPDSLESQSLSEDLNVMEAVTAATEAEKPQAVCSCRDDTKVIIGQEQASRTKSQSKDIYMVESVERFQDEQLQNSGSEIAENLEDFEADCDQPLELPASDEMGIELTPQNAAKKVDVDSKCHHRASAAPMKFLYTAAATAGILVAGAALLGCTYHRQVRSPL